MLFVYIVQGEFAGDELYVFDDDESAQAFAADRLGSTVTEEPVLDASFVEQARRSSA